MLRTLLVACLLFGAVTVACAQLQVTATPLPDGVKLWNDTLTPQVAPDYSNTTTATGFYFPGGAGAIVADDVLRTTNLPIRQVSFAYYAPGAAPDVVMYIYDLNNTLPAPLLASYNLGTLNGAGAWAYTITLPTPLSAPSDLWIGFSFSVADTGLLIYNPPTIGASDDVFMMDNVGLFWFGGSPVANFYLETVPVPEPASLLVLGSGVMGLLALRRRRA